MRSVGTSLTHPTNQQRNCWMIFITDLYSFYRVSCCSCSVITSSAQLKWIVTVTSAADTVCQVLCNVRMCKKCETKSRAAVFVLPTAHYGSLGISHFSLLCLTSVSSAPILSICLMASPQGDWPSTGLKNKPLTGGIKTVWEIKKKIVKKNSVGVWCFQQQPNIQGHGCL